MLNEYEYSDLADEEIVSEEARKKKVASDDAEKERQRLAQAANFRFSGGMC